ncbi:MAG: transporter substrate-binding domain-containing protein [Mesorhizobium sp.]|nr:transporter substrate-binding domain-containing protein [Mesorhizobium sp.]
MKRYMTTLAMLAALTIAGGAKAWADDKGGSLLDEVLARGYRTVGTGSTNAPFHFLDDKGELTGFDIDIAKGIARGLFNDETKVKFVDQGADARIANLLTKKVDITCQFMTVTPGRAQQVEFTIPYFTQTTGLLLLKDGKYKSYDELKKAGADLTVSSLQNVFTEEIIHRALPQAKVDQYESQDATVQALNSGRVDVAAIDSSNVRWLMKQEPERYADAGYTWAPNSFACAVRKGDQVWLNFVNTTLHEMMTGFEFDYYAASFEKWFGIKLDPPSFGVPSEFRSR